MFEFLISIVRNPVAMGLILGTILTIGVIGLRRAGSIRDHRR